GAVGPDRARGRTWRMGPRVDVQDLRPAGREARARPRGRLTAASSGADVGDVPATGLAERQEVAPSALWPGRGLEPPLTDARQPRSPPNPGRRPGIPRVRGF